MHREGQSSGSFGKLCYKGTDPAKTNISTHPPAGKGGKKSLLKTDFSYRKIDLLVCN